jgi:thiosulfate/3-mercaptopyruvate sulfurtransferase
MALQTLISTQQAAAELGRSDWLFVDCRHQLADVAWGEREYRTGHLPGAHFLHLDRDLSGPKTGSNGRHPLPDAAVLAAKLRALGMNPGSQLVVYDQGNGAMAARLWWLSRWLGHTQVAVLDGGYAKWQAEGRPLSAEMPEPLHGSFQAQVDSDCTRDSGWLLGHLGDADALIVDARTADRFAGENETLDPLGGHIPGAINRPWPDNLAADGCFKAAEVLRAEFQALLGDVAPTAIVNQCGSGVTACHNMLALEVAGLSGSRLYPGSWSEWCADSSRPIVLRQQA